MLTGKCLEDFNAWKAEFYQKWVNETCEGCFYYGYSQFKELPFVMKYGVYVDFFDQHDIVINVQKKTKGNQWWILRFSFIRYMRHFKTRNTTRKEGIIKANEIYNNKVNQ